MSQKAQATVWDSFLSGHFDAWLQHTVPQCERTEVEATVKSFVEEYPDVIARGLGWPQIAEMARRKW